MRGVIGSVLGMLNGGATHVGVATDHVIESFRNDLWPGYKTGEGIDPDLFSQFPLLEEAMTALGVATWPMVEYEADDALAAAALAASRDPRVEQVLICTPDKDLAQCVRGTRVVQLDRRRRITRDEAGVVEKFGVPPASIPDYLALVGDAADGYPGLPGWGAKSSAAVLAKYRPDRRHSRRLARVERERRQPREPGAHARARSGSRVSLQGSRDAPGRYSSVRLRRRAALVRTDSRIPAACRADGRRRHRRHRASLTFGGSASTSADARQRTRYVTDPMCGPSIGEPWSPITMSPARRSRASLAISSAGSP